jgi:thymidine kinase
MTEKLKGIAGSMYAGKTEELIKEICRTEYAKKKVLVFKPLIDDRWDAIDKIKSHSGKEHFAIPISAPEEIIDFLLNYLECLPKPHLVAIDEIQFFDNSIVEVIKFLLEEDIKVVYAGLSTDFRGEPFGSMPELLSLSDEIIRPTAVCEVCGFEASRTQRLINGKPANYTDPIIVIGDTEQYQARCPQHHEVPGKPKPKI